MGLLFGIILFDANAFAFFKTFIAVELIQDTINALGNIGTGCRIRFWSVITLVFCSLVLCVCVISE